MLTMNRPLLCDVDSCYCSLLMSSNLCIHVCFRHKETIFFKSFGLVLFVSSSSVVLQVQPAESKSKMLTMGCLLWKFCNELIYISPFFVATSNDNWEHALPSGCSSAAESSGFTRNECYSVFTRNECTQCFVVSCALSLWPTIFLKPNDLTLRCFFREVE